LEWADRWGSLSHGERKRAQIAAALWRRPDVLALDEPTNHLDAHAKGVLLAALKSFRGVGLLVSHDRDFLDALCSQCLFIFPPRIVMRPGGVSTGMEQDRIEQTRAKDQHDANAGKARRLQAAAQQRREAAEQSAALKTRAAKLLAPDAAIRVDYEMGFWLENSGKSSRNYVAELPEGEIDLGDGRTLVHPALSIRPDDRIALVGDNGLGKSTLVKKIVTHANVPPERLLVIPQEIGEEESQAIHADVKRLDRVPLGRVMTLISRLGSRPGRLLASTTPSPGEIRKILLARGVERGPHFIVMDEPTNHLDLPSIECLENALAETPCALLLVSHDERFLARLTVSRWQLTQSGTTVSLTTVISD